MRASPRCHLDEAHSPSVCPSHCCALAWLPQTTHGVGCELKLVLCLWAIGYSYRAGTVQPQWVLPLGCGGAGRLYTVSGVVLLVGFGPFDHETHCSWYALKVYQ